MIAFGQFLEVLISGLLSGVLYSLVALGFVLIFKASGVFNFAQGAMVLLAGLALVRSLDCWWRKGLPFWAAVVLGSRCSPAVIMAIYRVADGALRARAAGQSGRPDAVHVDHRRDLHDRRRGADDLRRGVYPLQLFPTDAWFVAEGVFPGGILRQQARRLGRPDRRPFWSRGLRCSSSRPRPAARCARSPTITPPRNRSAFRLNWIWFVVWLVAGLVALVAATVWGTKLGVQFSITFLALKALPVLIIGGFTSVPGAIVGGLIVGAGEKLAEAYLGPFMGGGIEYWFGYVLALVVLLVRPQGLFGERIIERI